MQRDETGTDREGSTGNPVSKKPLEGQMDLFVEEIMGDAELIDRLWDEYFLKKHGHTPVVRFDANGKPYCGQAPSAKAAHEEDPRPREVIDGHGGRD